MSKPPNIRFSPNILRRLGEELNPNPDQGILELVKNSYDADADNCTIEFIDIDSPRALIRITDDGIGMTQKELTDGWLVLGKSDKTKAKPTNKGRVTVGNKGLGRLAALRLGSAVELKTVSKGNHKREISLNIDWRDFDNVDIVEEVELDLKVKTLKKNKRNGTEIEIKGISHRFTQAEIRRIARQLVLLADPFSDKKGSFRPILKVEAHKELEELVSRGYFAEADYHLSAEIDSEGKASAKAYDWKGDMLFEANHFDIAKKKNKTHFDCMPCTFDLWIYIMDAQSFSTKNVSKNEVQEWLKNFGGIHIYENSIRVSPYGDPGNDWLGMNLQRVKSPEERPGTNTSIGKIEILDNRGSLEQKTDRSGYIDSTAFSELKLFSQNSMDWLASKRLEVAEIKRTKERNAAPTKSEKTKREFLEVIEGSDSRQKAELKAAFTAFDRSMSKEINTLKKEVQLYRTLSTAGITAATFAHESSGNPIKVISHGITTLNRRIKDITDEEVFSSRFEPTIQLMKNSMKGLAVLGTITLNLLDHQKRRTAKVDIHETISAVVHTFSPFLSNREVTVEQDFAEGSPFFRGSTAAMESIIANLINNSLSFLEKAEADKRKIRISTIIESKTINIVFSDNGPGIKDINLKDIWLPGRSTRDGGTGLGLTIIKDAVTDLSGDVRAQPNGELGGAEFSIILPIIGT